jgi:response regulator NasT
MSIVNVASLKTPLNTKTPESVLVVSSSEAGAEVIASFLPPSGVSFAQSAAEARRKLADYSFDIVIINTPLSDESGTQLALDFCAGMHSVFLLIVKNEHFDEISSHYSEFGILSAAKPISKSVFHSTMLCAVAMSASYRRFEEEKRRLQTKVDEIKIISRAKAILMQYLGMSEETAHRYVEKQAMDMRMTKRSVAENILKTYEN